MVSLGSEFAAIGCCALAGAAGNIRAYFFGLFLTEQ